MLADFAMALYFVKKVIRSYLFADEPDACPRQGVNIQPFRHASRTHARFHQGGMSPKGEGNPSRSQSTLSP